MTERDALRFVLKKIKEQFARVPGFLAPLDQTVSQAVYFNFLVVRYSHMVSKTVNRFSDRHMGIILRGAAEGIEWLMANEAPVWFEAGKVIKSVLGAGLPANTLKCPELDDFLFYSPDNWAGFWKKNGSHIIAAAIAGDVTARKVVENPPFIPLPSGWRSPSSIQSYLEERLQMPGTRPKEAIRLALEVLKTAPPVTRSDFGTYDLVEVAAQLLQTVGFFKKP